MKWKPDFCAGGKCEIEINIGNGEFWTPESVVFLKTCDAHAVHSENDRFEVIKNESQTKEAGRAEVAKSMGYLTADGEIDSEKIAFEFDADRNIILHVPLEDKPSLIVSKQEDIENNLSKISNKLIIN